jgi:hypothetical protein
MCSHFAIVFTQCGLALGYNVRQVILANHYVAEAWSNEYKKWILMDVEAVQSEGWDRHGTALYWDTVHNVPMSGLDLHRAVVSGSVSTVTQKLYMTDTSDPNSTYRLYDRVYGVDQYGNFKWFAYPPRNNYLDQLEPWEVDHGWNYYHSEDYLWWRDENGAGRVEYSGQTNRERDLGWSLNQVALTLTAAAGAGTLSVAIDTVTLNFDVFLYRIDGGAWQTLAAPGSDPTCRQATLTWSLHSGSNTLEAKPRNLFGLGGIVSSATVTK